MVREGLAALLSAEPDMRIIGQGGNGLEVLEAIQECRPDVVVLDISMPGLNGLDVCREIGRGGGNGISVLIVTMHRDEQFIRRALQNGAAGYLMKEAASEQLAEAIRRVAKGESYLGQGVSPRMLETLGKDRKDPYETLSTRERQVLQQIAEGKTNRQIAEVLGLATKTVDTHRTRLMRKLNIHDQTSLVKFAISRGVIRMPGPSI
jgi:DNA-binding NarL/FixJ family response regulator